MKLTAHRSRLLGLVPAILAAATTVACGNGDSDTSAMAGTPNPPAAQVPGTASPNDQGRAAAERAVAEADIVQLASGKLYALSRAGTLSIIDVSVAGRLRMLGQAYLPGEPFEMYVKDGLVIAMMNGAYAVSGAANEPAPPPVDLRGDPSIPSSPTPTIAATPAVRDKTTGAGVMAIDAHDPAFMSRVATFPVAGEIADSRMVGDILYLATYENGTCFRCGAGQRTLVTSFDLSTRTEMRIVDQVVFDGFGASGWGADAWKRSLVLAGERLYVGGHSDVPTGQSGDEGVIDVVDVSDPSGRLVTGAHLSTPGAIMSRWQVDERDGVLRVVSQRGAGYAVNGIGMPQVQTFHIWNSGSFQKMGQLGIQMPKQEALKSVHFDKDRAYAITFGVFIRPTDPLFVIDLASPATPRQRGSLEMPGWVFHLEPRGSRLLGLGLDRESRVGHLNVSLFDVADMDHPRMLQRVHFGATGGAGSDQQITAYELPEDQDRIQKAFRVLDNGLIVAPYSGAGGSPTTCATGGGVQLISWGTDTLTKQAVLPVAGNPRRALLNHGDAELIAVSDSNVTAFNLSRREAPLQTADSAIGACEPRPTSTSTVAPGGVVGSQRWTGDDDMGDSRWACSSAPGSRDGRAPVSGAALLGIALALATVRRRLDRIETAKAGRADGARVASSGG